MRARMYDPAVGRFTGPDPIGLAGGFNLYDFSTVTADDTTLGLFDGTGARLAFNDDDPSGGGYHSLIEGFTAPASGTYWLDVRGFSSSTPDYTVTAAPQ